MFETVLTKGSILDLKPELIVLKHDLHMLNGLIHSSLLYLNASLASPNDPKSNFMRPLILQDVIFVIIHFFEASPFFLYFLEHCKIRISQLP